MPPYQSPSPALRCSTRNAPRSCLSKPIAMPRSNTPDLIVLNALNSAEPPVAQPFATLMNCKPVRPELRHHRVGGAGCRRAAEGELHVVPLQTGSRRAHGARRSRPAPCRTRRRVRPNSCMPMPTIATSSLMTAVSVRALRSGPVGCERERDDLVAVVVGGQRHDTSSISIPIVSLSGSASVSRVSTLT